MRIGNRYIGIGRYRWARYHGGFSVWTAIWYALGWEPPKNYSVKYSQWPWVRWQRDVDGLVRDRRWFWTPVTKRFGHGGWVFLSMAWLRRFWNGA